jgi:tetratricopeptide (TPR) repeat protein
MKGLSPDSLETGKIKYEFFRDDELFLIESREVSTIKEGLNFKQGFSLQNFGPAHYKIKVSLWFNDREILSQWEEFDVTSVAMIPRPWCYNKELPPTSDPAYNFILGKQYFNRGDVDQARIKFEMAYNKNFNSRDLALELARVYLIQQRYVNAKEILLPFSKAEEAPYHVLFILGKSHQALGEYNQAIDIYNKAVSHFGTNIDLLNSLGECYFNLGIMEDAFDAWKTSLEINPDQPDIKRKIESIK